MKLNNNDDSHNSGLNLLIYNMLLDIGSHPAWVCGLKLCVCQWYIPWAGVTPCVGVWIETLRLPMVYTMSRSHTLRGCVDWNIIGIIDWWTSDLSHPAWVCGLKPFINVTAITGNSHTLRGCVDWNSISLQYGLGGMVTPCVGVWIETRSTLLAFLTSSSHPAWVCGLKQILSV